MAGSRPSDPKGPTLAPKPGGEPAKDRPHDKPTLEVLGSTIHLAMAEHDAAFDERETAPPPLPVAEYVRSMMQQVDPKEEHPSEPPKSRVPLSFRGEPPSSSAPPPLRAEPRMPHSWRPGPLGDAPPKGVGLRPLENAPGAAAPRSPRAPPPPDLPPSSRSPRTKAEDEEFARRPLALRVAEPSRAPAEPDPWADFESFVTAEPPPPSTDEVRTPSSPAELRVPSSPAELRTPPKTPVPKTPGGLRALRVTPAAPSRPPLGGLGQRLPAVPAAPLTALGRPLPPPPIPKGAPVHSTPAIIPRVAMGSLLSSRATPPRVVRPASDLDVDAELDSLPFDDLVAASHRSASAVMTPDSSRITAPPPTVVAPPPLKASITSAGLRLGKQPLSSFPAALEDLPPEETDAGDIPPILDVAWAFNAASLSEPGEDEEDHRDAVLPGSGRGARPAAEPPLSSSRLDDESLPPILSAGWAFPKSSYDESNEITTTGDDELVPIDELEARVDEGDFEGAIVLAERLLARDPEDARARSFAELARDRLIDIYSVEVGGQRCVPHVIMNREEMQWLSLDHRTGFLLSCIDGRLSIEEVLDVSGMPELDALRCLRDLREQGVILLETVEPPTTRR